jgi:hypothetical protein
MVGAYRPRNGFRVGFMRRFMAIGLVVAILGIPELAWGILEPGEDTWTDTGDFNDRGPKKDVTPAPSETEKIPVRRGAGSASGRRFAPPISRARPEDPDAIAVVIANSRYRNGIPAVDYARNDGQAAQAMMRDIFGLRPGNIIVLEDAGQADLFSIFGNTSSHEGKLWSWVRPGRSKIYVYYSGHGVPGTRDGRAYLLPVDADPGTAEINGYPLELLYRNLAKLGVRSVTVILESCFSGLTERGPLIRSASPVFLKATQPTVGSGLTILSAAQSDQIASWDHAAGLGMFTHYLMRALYGEADGGRWGNGDGNVTLGEIETYLDDEMSYAARREYRRVQQSSLIGDRQAILGAVGVGSGVSTPGSQPARTAPSPGPARRGSTSSWAGSAHWDGSLPGARSFVTEHRTDVVRAIKAYYFTDGKVWDEEIGGHGNVYGAERMDAVSELKVTGVTDDSIELRVVYAWSNSYVAGAGTASMRLKIDADGTWIDGMWR